MNRIRITAAAGGAIALAALLAAGPAQAAGFAIKEQSGTALGNAFAGATAEAGDISYMFFNPAGLTRHRGNRAAISASYVAPQTEPDGMQASRAAGLGGTSIAGGDGGGDIGADAIVPSLYGLLSLSPDLKLGIGVNAPFGLRTEYDRGWAGRYHALDSELATINVNPNLAYRPLDWLSLGLGAQVQYADAELTNAVDFGAIGAFRGVPGAVPGGADGLAEVTGDDVGFGAAAGLLLEPSARTRIGLAYRSQVFHELDGEADFSGGGAIRQGLAAAGAFADTGVRAKLTTPDTASAGIYHELSPRWAVMGEVQWTNWSDFQSLRIRFDNATPTSVTEEDWENSWFAAAGATFRPREDLALRAGVAFDESPIPDATRTPRVPGGDRAWLALGANWRPLPYLSLDAGYTHIFVDDTTVDLQASDPGNGFRGNLSGDYETSIDIFTVQATLRF